MSRSILLIEDNAQNRYLATFLLEHHGHRVTTAPDGPTGIELARTLRPEMILLDIQLPGMNGYEIARTLRACPELEAIPLIAVTSYAMVGDRERAMAAGCTGYIEKPIDPDTFVAMVEGFAATRKPDESATP